MKEWRNYFEKRILDRGNDYFFEDRVFNLELEKINNTKYISAKVEGFDTYDVDITINNNDIINMNCSCLYGDNCKHIVATLLEYEECKEELEDNPVNLRDAIESLSEKDVKEILISVVRNNKQIKQKVLAKVDSPHKIIRHIEDEIKRISYQYDYELEGYEFDNFYNDMEIIINDFINVLINKKYFNEAKKYLNEITSMIYEKNTCDDDNLYELVNECEALILEIKNQGC